MYKNIEIFETDFKDKYLIINNEKSIYGGFIIKEIVELLKQDKDYKKITSELSLKYKNNFEDEVINNIIVEKINPLLEKDKYTGFKKLFKIIDPNKISVPPFVEKYLINKNFYFLFIVSFVTNIIYFFHIKNIKYSTSPIEQIIIYVLLIIILIIHELGHSFSAKLFKVNVKEIGFAIYYIFPVFFINLNESWKLDKMKRTIINLSGIYFQLIIGNILIISSSIMIIHNCILEYLFKLNFLIIIYNLNPFIKFDGYWVLSDILNENNLNKKSNEILGSFLKFENKKSSAILLSYTLLKLLFYFWLFFHILTFLNLRISYIITYKNIELIDLFIIVIILFIIYNSLSNKKNNKNEHLRTKKTL